MDLKTIDTTTPEGLRELDAEIARRLGYTVEWDNNEYMRDWTISKPKEFDRLPHYTTDLNAAWSLFQTFPEGVDWEMRIVGDKTQEIGLACKWMHIAQDGSGQFFDMEEGKPALAICQVWLEWKDFVEADNALD